MHRELDCEGPVKLRLSMGANDVPVMLGPFAHVRTAAGMLYGDESCLNIFVPGQKSRHLGCVPRTDAAVGAAEPRPEIALGKD